MPTTYYVDFVNGNDANNGQGPDASHISNKPWKTLTKLLGAAGMASGDTAYLSPAGPFRETVSVAMVSPVAETKILGDPGNAQGFKTSGGVRVTPGRVEWTAFTTNDKTAPSTTTLLNLNGRDFFTFERISMVGANVTASCVTATTTTSTNITFRDVTFLPRHNDQVVNATTVFGTAFTWLFERCRFGPCSGTQALLFTCPTGTGSDYDIGVTIHDCIFLASGGTQAISPATSGASAQKPGGIIVRNCTFLDCRALLYPTLGSSSVPGQFQNNVVYSLANTWITVNGGTVNEDYNLVYGTAAGGSGTLTSGGHSVTNASYAWLFNFFNQEMTWYAPEPRPFMEPLKDGPALVFGNDGNQQATDILGLPRPSSAFAAAGAYGTRHNSYLRDPSPIGSGATPMKIVGPGDQGFRLSVRTGTTYTISVVVKWDATYSGTKPQLQIDANPRIGVVAETKTATGGSGSNETLTLTAITPVNYDFDFVVCRVISNDTNGAGVLQADDMNAAV